MASLWNIEQNTVYGTYYFDGKLSDITHFEDLDPKKQGLAHYSPDWLYIAEPFISNFLKDKTELATTHRHILQWLITIHGDAVAEDIENPLQPTISMQPHLT